MSWGLIVCTLAVQLTSMVCKDAILEPSSVCEPRSENGLYLDRAEEQLMTTSVCDNNLTFVTRTEWESRPTKTTEYMKSPVSILFIHHTVMSECFTLIDCSKEVRVIQDFHMDKKSWDDIGYNFVIGGDGRAYEGRGWDRVGAHTLGWNNISVSFSVMGDYTDHLPTTAALNAIDSLIYRGIILRKLTPDFKLYGHRDARPTESPGEKLYQLIRTYSHYDPGTPVKPKLTPDN